MVRIERLEQLDRSALAAAISGAIVAAVGVVLPVEPMGWFTWTGPGALAMAVAPGGPRPRLRGLILGLIASAAALVWMPHRLLGEVTTGALLAAILVWRSNRSWSWTQWTSVLLGAVAWPLSLRLVEHASRFDGALLLAAAGALAGLIIGLMPFPTHLIIDGVGRALQRVRPILDVELRGLVERIVEARARALRALQRSRADARVRSETRRALDGIVLTAVELTNRFSEVERVLGRTKRDGLSQRTQTLSEQLEASTDAGAKRDLERALVSLTEQQEQIERLEQGRARLVARLESELASLEKTEMSLALLASGDAAVSGIRLGAIGAALARQAQALDAEGSSLQEALAQSDAC